MRTYFDKLLNSSQQQKQLPFDLSLFDFAYFQVPYLVLHWHLIIIGGWRFCHQHYFMHALRKRVAHNQLFHWLGLWFWLMVCRCLLALYLNPCLW